MKCVVLLEFQGLRMKPAPLCPQIPRNCSRPQPSTLSLQSMIIMLLLCHITGAALAHMSTMYATKRRAGNAMPSCQAEFKSNVAPCSRDLLKSGVVTVLTPPRAAVFHPSDGVEVYLIPPGRLAQRLLRTVRLMAPPHQVGGWVGPGATLCGRPCCAAQLLQVSASVWGFKGSCCFSSWASVHVAFIARMLMY
jgi:hypothetical protein